MKKILYIIFAIVLFCPAFVNAKLVITPDIPDKVIKDVDKGNNVNERTYDAYIIVDSDETIKSIAPKFDFVFGKAIKSFSCGNSDDGKFEASTDTANNACVFTAVTEEEVKGKVKVGTLTVEVDKTFPEEDCSINYYIGTVQGEKINPTTGFEVPYLYLIGGIVVAGIIFYSTKRKIKFGNI